MLNKHESRSKLKRSKPTNHVNNRRSSYTDFETQRDFIKMVKLPATTSFTMSDISLEDNFPVKNEYDRRSSYTDFEKQRDFLKTLQLQGINSLTMRDILSDENFLVRNECYSISTYRQNYNTNNLYNMMTKINHNERRKSDTIVYCKKEAMKKLKKTIY